MVGVGSIDHHFGNLSAAKTKPRRLITKSLPISASGLIYGLMEGKEPQQAVEYGAAHGALAMTTPGDTTTASLAEVEKVMAGGTARVDR